MNNVNKKIEDLARENKQLVELIKLNNLMLNDLREYVDKQNNKIVETISKLSSL